MAAADDHRDVAVLHGEVAGQRGRRSACESPAPCAPLAQALRAEGGVVTVSGLDNGSSPNRAKTLPRATHPHHGASRVTLLSHEYSRWRYGSVGRRIQRG